MGDACQQVNLTLGWASEEPSLCQWLLKYCWVESFALWHHPCHPFSWCSPVPHSSKKKKVYSNFFKSLSLTTLGYCNKIPYTERLRNNKCLFVTVLEAGNLRLGCQHGQVLGESPLPGLRTAFFMLNLHMVEGEPASSLWPHKATNPNRAPPSWPNPPPKFPPPNTIPWG